MCAFAFGALSGARMTLIPSLQKTASKARLNFASRSWIRNRGRWSRFVDVDQQVARLLHHPGAVGVVGAGHVFDPAAADADEDEHVEPAQQDGVNGEEVAGECRRGVLAQERAPVRPSALGCRWNTGRPEHVADQRGGDVDPERACAFFCVSVGG
jgi:hypothetical protein